MPSSPIVTVENLSKRYTLGVTHLRSMRETLSEAWSRITSSRTKNAAAQSHPRRVERQDFWALRNVSFSIERGELIGIIGRNGAGKSTLLKILSRITRPTEGRAVLRGRVASLLEVGTGFHAELTGRENVFLNGAILGMSRAEVSRQFESIVDFAGVETFIDTPVKRYSSGMVVRLGFAVAAHLRPEIMIVDEVLAVGDAAFQQKCIGRMSDLGKEGRTVIFVSHSMPAIQTLTERCFVIDEGQIAFSGPSAAAVDWYLSLSRGNAMPVLEVSHLPRASWVGDRSVELVTAAFLGSDVAEGRHKSLRLQLGVRGRADVASYCFGLTLHRRGGEAIGSGFTTECGPIRHGETQAFEVVMSDPGLAPGHYHFTVGVLRSGNDVVDVIAEVMPVDMSASGKLPSGVHTWNPGWGQLALDISCSSAHMREQAQE